MAMPMSLVNDQTQQLWQQFMRQKHNLPPLASEYLYSLQQYPAGYFSTFSTHTFFTKWALAEVGESNQTLPDDFTTFAFEGGDYFMVEYKGDGSDAALFFQNLYTQIIPEAGYAIDHRPHFERLGPRYQRESKNSLEEVFIPVIRLA